MTTIGFVFIVHFLPLPSIFPITLLASGANAAAIGKNPPFSAFLLPSINLLFFKYSPVFFLSVFFFTSLHLLVCLHCTLYSSLWVPCLIGSINSHLDSIQLHAISFFCSSSRVWSVIIIDIALPSLFIFSISLV